jgi:hypothetical protein
VQQLAQAVPSATGPDLYSISTSADGTQSVIQGLKADGEQLSQTTVPAVQKNAVPDGSGGLIVTSCPANSPMTVTDLDATGQTVWQIQSALVQGFGYICVPPNIAVAGNGTAYVAEPTNAGLPSMSIGSPNGYASGFSFPPSTVTKYGRTTNVLCCVGEPMVNTDGTAYVEYEVRNTVNDVITSDTLYLWISTSGSIVLSSTTQDQALLPGSIIPNGNGGILATWAVSPSHSVLPFPYQAAAVTGFTVGTPYNLPFSPQTVTPFVTPTLVLGENGTAFAAGPTTIPNNGGFLPVDQIASFSVNSGATNWTYQGATGVTLSIIMSTDGNGLVARSTDQSGNDTLLTFDSSGNYQTQARRFLPSNTPNSLAVPQQSLISQMDYYKEGNYLGIQSGSALSVAGSLAAGIASAPGARPRGDAQHNGTTDPGFVLVAFQDCHLVKASGNTTIWGRIPRYYLRAPGALLQPLQCNSSLPFSAQNTCYTVFEYIAEQDSSSCTVGGRKVLSPCDYADGTLPLHPYNQFDDEISTLLGGAFFHTQYFDYGFPGQRMWDVYRIYRTLPDGTLQSKQSSPACSYCYQKNLLNVVPQTDPLIDGNPDPWLAPWDGHSASCNDDGSKWFSPPYLN